MNVLSMSQAAKECGVAARVLSDLRYQGKLAESHFHRVGRLTLVPRKSLPAIRRVLARLGKLQTETV
jgi:hypothetical protein